MSALIYAAVHQIAREHYSEIQLNAWMAEPLSEATILGWAEDGRIMRVVTDESDLPLAFVDLENDGHIDHLFCHPDYAGKGVTRQLYEALEALARDRYITQLYVEASESAKTFFARQGFAVDHRRDFEVRGVPIHNYRMVKAL